MQSFNLVAVSRVPVKNGFAASLPSMRGRILVAILLLAAGLAAPLQFAGAQSPAAAPASATLLPHDTHEGFTISADPYTNADRAKAKFGKDHPVGAGILPIDVLLTNNSEMVLRVRIESIRFEVSPSSGPRQELQPLSADEVAERIAFPAGAANPSQSRVPLPLPIPHHSKKADKIAENLRPLALDADVIGPHATIHGFLFFNLAGEFNLVPGATLYVPDVRAIAGSHTLTFFEVVFPTLTTP
jgi:hypothetical protein